MFLNNVSSIFSLKNILMLLSLIVLMMLVNAGYCATSSGGDMPWSSGLEKLQSSIEGPVATTICILGIVGCGAGLAFGGEMNQVIKTMLILVMVCATVVLASKLLRSITGTSAILEADTQISAQVENKNIVNTDVVTVNR